MDDYYRAVFRAWCIVYNDYDKVYYGRSHFITYEYKYSFEADDKVQADNVMSHADEDKPEKWLTNANKTYGIPVWNEIKSYFETEQSMAQYLVDEYPGVLKIPTHCGQCGCGIRPGYDPKKLRVRCYKCKNRPEFGKEWNQSIWKGSFFQDARNGKEAVMVFLYKWLTGDSSTSISIATGWSTKKVQHWMMAVQDLISTVVMTDDIQIGGPGVVVEIDESKFGKRKYHKGHRVEGAWVFGGVELTHERKAFAVVVPNRTKATLLPLIAKHIAPGSIIRSDQWSAYYDRHSGEGLADWLPWMGYEYECVNHSEHFLDPETGVHTNTIEGTWSGIKRKVPVAKRTKKHLQGCLFEFIWRRNNEGNLWNGLMRALYEISYQSSDECKKL